MAYPDLDDYDYYKYLLDKETLPKKLNNVSEEIRATTIDWIIRLGFRSDNSVIHMTVVILDKFLSSNNIESKYLEVAGATCFFIASKYNDVYPPKIAELVFSMDGAATKNDLTEMEVLVLKSIDYQVRIPSANTFLCNLVRLLPQPLYNNSFELSSYYTEISLLTTSSLQFPYSTIAASSLVLSQIVLEVVDPWPENVVKMTNLQLSDMHDCILFISFFVSRAKEYPQTKGVREKYGYKRYNSVARLKQPDNLTR